MSTLLNRIGLIRLSTDSDLASEVIDVDAEPMQVVWTNFFFLGFNSRLGSEKVAVRQTVPVDSRKTGSSSAPAHIALRPAPSPRQVLQETNRDKNNWRTLAESTLWAFMVDADVICFICTVGFYEMSCTMHRCMYVMYVVVEQPIGTTTRLYKAFTTVGVGGGNSGNSGNFGRRHHRTMHAGLSLLVFLAML